MSSEEDLRINTLHRFAKHSPRLTLQEYSHCEVPAGCGGVVLRWIDPRRGPSVQISISALGSTETWLDGQLLTGARVQFTSGAHVLAFRLENPALMKTGDQTTVLEPPIPVGIDLTPDAAPRQQEVNRLGNAHPFRACWSAESFAEPPIAVDFDDRDWLEAEPLDSRVLARQPDRIRSFYDRRANQGATVLQIGTERVPLERAWLRISFSIEWDAR